MRLRILASKTIEKKYGKDDQLKILYKSEGVIIHDSDNVRTIDLKGGRKAFLTGYLVGIRSSQDEIASCSYFSAVLEELIRTKEIEEYREVLEGRILIHTFSEKAVNRA